jgi:hypothetical protein
MVGSVRGIITYLAAILNAQVMVMALFTCCPCNNGHPKLGVYELSLRNYGFLTTVIKLQALVKLL